jgi:hypothetical protein
MTYETAEHDMMINLVVPAPNKRLNYEQFVEELHHMIHEIAIQCDVHGVSVEYDEYGLPPSENEADFYS